MKKKLDTRFPAARIKKIMQADEDVGKIAMAVPLLVSKALELFLQDLCNQTHEITLKKGAKTVNSLHLKQCVQTLNMFDFLREIVSKVPDLGEADATGEDHAAPKIRKVIEDGANNGDKESKRSRGSEIIHYGCAMRGRGQGKGQGRGQGARDSDGDMLEQNGKFEDDDDLCEHDSEYPERADIGAHHIKSKENARTVTSEDLPNRNFDLNVSLDENGDSKPMVAGSTDALSFNMKNAEKHEDCPGWSLSEVEKMAIEPLQ